MLEIKEQLLTDKLFYREETGEGEYDLWISRITNHIDWLKNNYWNGYSSWKAAYLLDRTIHWARKGFEKGNEIDFATERAQQKVTIPLIATHIRNLLPYLAYSEPNFYGRPDSAQQVLNINAQTDYLNHFWRIQNMSRQSKKSILDGAIIGHGIAKSGWSPRLSDEPDERGKGKINYLPYNTPNTPWVRRINPFLFLYDRTASDYDLASARWCCELILKPFGAIVNEPSYDKDVVALIKKGGVNLLYYRDFVNENIEDDQLFAPYQNEKEQIDIDQQIVLCEIWDRMFQKYYVIPMGQHQYALRDESWPYDYLDKFPYRMVLFEEVPNDLFGMGHVRYLKDVSAQINRNRTSIYDISNRFSPLYKYRSQDKSISAENARILREHPPGGVLTLGLQEGEDVTTLDPPSVSDDTWRVSTILEKDFQLLSGEDQLAQGGPLPSRTSAEEIRERRRIRGLRLETSVQNAHNFYLDLGNLVLTHARNNIESDVVVPVIGKPGRYWNRINPSNFKDIFTLDLGVISKPPDPPEVRRKDLMELFTTLANPNLLQLFQQFQIPVPLAYLWRLLLESYEIPELAPMMPEQEAMMIPEAMEIFNTGNQSKTEGNGKVSPASTRQIQQDNVNMNSEMQGMEGMLSSVLNRAG